MAQRSWKVLPGGKVKRWKASSHGHTWLGVPPRWIRNVYNRRERRLSGAAIKRGRGEASPFVHPREAGWYW